MNKIILDCDLMRHRDSGLYHYCLNLGNAVQRLIAKNQDEKIAFYVPSREKKSFDKDTNCIVEKNWHGNYFKPFLWDCNVWHAPFQSGRVLPSGNKHVKVLLTIHDLNCLHEGKSKKEQDESLRKTQHMINQSHALVCISEHCKNDVIRHMNVHNKPLYVIHNGTHQVITPPQVPQLYHPKKPFLFTLGYVNRKKNFHSLIPLLKKEDMDLVVAGKLDEPDYVDFMMQMADSFDVKDRLHILGSVSEGDKSWYMNNCTAFMMPSLAEGFGAPVVEAMAFGKPIFLSNRTSLPEIGADAAFYFHNFEEEHMHQVYREGMMLYKQNRLSNKIKERGRLFNWEEKAKEYLELYRSLY